MRPIPSPASNEAIALLNKAQQLLEKAENFQEQTFTLRDAQKKKMEKELGQTPVQKAGDAGTQPTYNVTFNTNPENIGFVSETAGQTRSAYYNTNQHLLDSEDVANKGATSSSVSLEKLGGQMNPHDGDGVDRLDEDGKLSKAFCPECGGNQYSGCRNHIQHCPNLSER